MGFPKLKQWLILASEAGGPLEHWRKGQSGIRDFYERDTGVVTLSNLNKIFILFLQPERSLGDGQYSIGIYNSSKYRYQEPTQSEEFEIYLKIMINRVRPPPVALAGDTLSVAATPPKVTNFSYWTEGRSPPKEYWYTHFINSNHNNEKYIVDVNQTPPSQIASWDTIKSEAEQIFSGNYPSTTCHFISILIALDKIALDSVDNVQDRNPLNECLPVGDSIDLPPLEGSKVSLYVRSLRQFKNIILEGPPGTGKTHAFKNILKELRPDQNHPQVNARMMVFHPSTSYEDFVEGLRPVSASTRGKYFHETTPVHEGSSTQASPQNSPGFAVRDGFFVEACAEAYRKPEEIFVLLLDEFNRANIPKVLGDLLLSVEASKRWTWKDSTWQPPEKADLGSSSVTLPASQRKFFVPDNVLIVATMNTSDRSVAPLDAALRRRFAILRLDPFSQKELRQSLNENFPDLTNKPDFRKFGIAVWESLNNNVICPLLGPDYALGHSYFYEMGDGKDDKIKLVWRYKILPQLIESLVNADALDLLGLGRSTWLEQRKRMITGDTDQKIRAAGAALTELDAFLNKLGMGMVLDGSGLGQVARVIDAEASSSSNSETDEADADEEPQEDSAS